MPVNYRPYTIPLNSGLNQKPDKRALQQPSLAEALDVQFEDVGGLQTRPSWSGLGADIFGGGTLSNVRKVYQNGDELLCFTKSGLYSWSDRDVAWVYKSEYLATKLEERGVFINPSEQTNCDRAELDNVVVFAWQETRGSTTQVYLAAEDKTTGAQIMAPTALAWTTERVRLVPLTTKILVFAVSDSDGRLSAFALDPDDLEGTVDDVATEVFGLGFDSYYDVTSSAGVAYAVGRDGATGTGYWVASCTEALSVSNLVKGRTANGPIALSVAPNGTHIQVIRVDGTNIEGDYLSIAGPFTDVNINQAVGTFSSTCNQVTACHRSVQDSSQYRCYAFWSTNETEGHNTTFELKWNWVDTGNNLGIQARFKPRLGIVSRAFDYEGKVYLWTGFGTSSSVAGMANPAGFRAALQNTYFLYRDDQLLCGKAATAKSGGYSCTTGRLPGVQSLGSGQYAWAGEERRVIPLSAKQSGYSARAPHEIIVTFDSNEARRCYRLGRTLYITGAEILQYDGNALYEVGFHLYPWYFLVTTQAGSVDAGTYAYKGTYRHDNAQGERDRSTTATVETAESTGVEEFIAGIDGLMATHKLGIAAPTLEVWRTAKNPAVGAPFFLASSQDPSVTTGDNDYLENDPSTLSTLVIVDALEDSSLTTREPSPENDGVLESLAPPPATIIAGTQDRLFLAGISDNPYKIVYSKLRGSEEIAAFHEALAIELPSDGGKITALAFLNETLIAFCETAIYSIPGVGFGNVGDADGSQNYGPSRQLASDVGAVSAEAVGLTPEGLIFKSRKGWYLLRGNGAVEYIGGAVADYDSDEVLAINVVESQHQVRILTDQRMLVLDYYAKTESSPLGQWAEWTVTDGVHATMWQGQHTYAATSMVNTISPGDEYANVDYGMDAETAWIKTAGLMDYVRVRKIQILGEYRSACRLRVRLAFDYDESDATGPNFVYDKTLTVTPTTIGGPLHLEVYLPGSWQKCVAFKVRITAVHVTTDGEPPAGEAIKLTGLGCEIGFKGRLGKGLPSAQRQ